MYNNNIRHVRKHQPHVDGASMVYKRNIYSKIVSVVILE